VPCEEAVKRLKDGAEFAQVPHLLDAPDSLQGGVIGWRSQQRLPELYVETLAPLKPGDISGVFRSPAIPRTQAPRAARRRRAPARGGRRMCVIYWCAPTSSFEDEAKRKLLSLRERIVNGVNFAELARLNSDDGSASRAGIWDGSIRRYRDGIRAGF